MKKSCNNESLQSKLVRLYIGELKGLKTIGKQIHSDPRTFKNVITSLGIEIPYPGSIWCKVSQHLSRRFYKPLPKWKMELVIGSLLGDSQIRLESKLHYHAKNPNIIEYSNMLLKTNKIRKKARKYGILSQKEIKYWNSAIELIKNTNTASFRIHKSILEIKWVKLLAQIFNENLNITTFVNKADNKSTKWSCGFDSSSSIHFFEIWKEWYTKQRGAISKNIPKLPPLTPNILLHWYIDDGYMSGYDTSLCTQAFSYKEHLVLLKYLKTAGIESNIRVSKGKPYIGISMKKQNKKDFYSFISHARLYKQARNLFPYKFTNSISKREWNARIIETSPDYFRSEPNAKERLLSELQIK
ncbi:MAG: hypothetical protein KGD64_00405 [Candidatus Heimdallarchaeota archaeon]|nr:hypothetical protein [Candidatus Heimdallarchaeota archaeon]